MPNASEPTLKLSDLPSSRLPALFLALLTVLTSGLISLISAFGLNASMTPASHPPTRVATVAKLAALMGGLHGSVVIGNSLRAGPLQAQPAYAYDLAINNGVRYPTAGPWTITAPLGTTTHMGPARTNAPSTLLPLAAEEGASGLDASELQMSSTVEQHISDLTKDGSLARPYGSSTLTIQNIMDAGTPVADPGGVPGALRWDVAGALNGSSGTWELVVDPQTKTILHFLFKSG